MTWIHREYTSIREDGAKVGAFIVEGKPEWWAYPKGWTARGNVPAVGPWPNRTEAIASLDSVLEMT